LENITGFGAYKLKQVGQVPTGPGKRNHWQRKPESKAKSGPKQIMFLKENPITGHLNCPKKAPERKSDVA